MSDPTPPNQFEHRYDDIVEHDNPLPRWWLLTFYATIVFGIGYFFHYQVFRSAATPDEELAEDRRVAKAKSGKADLPPSAPELNAMARDPKALEEGGKTYAETCAVCHGDKGEGKIGPNLTDDTWIHGGSSTAIFRTISQGVPEKGMTAWGQALGPVRVAKVTAYVISLRGKNVPGKAPQGEIDRGD